VTDVQISQADAPEIDVAGGLDTEQLRLIDAAQGGYAEVGLPPQTSGRSAKSPGVRERAASRDPSRTPGLDVASVTSAMSVMKRPDDGATRDDDVSAGGSVRAGDVTRYGREARARPNGLPSASRQIAHREPGWITLPPSAVTRSSAARTSATVK
jgi:hypothetical protein